MLCHSCDGPLVYTRHCFFKLSQICYAQKWQHSLPSISKCQSDQNTEACATPVLPDIVIILQLLLRPTMHDTDQLLQLLRQDRYVKFQLLSREETARLNELLQGTVSAVAHAWHSHLGFTNSCTQVLNLSSALDHTEQNSAQHSRADTKRRRSNCTACLSSRPNGLAEPVPGKHFQMWDLQQQYTAATR